MNRLLKFIGVLLAIVVMLGILATIFLPRIIDPDSYRDDIARIVHDNSGLTLRINGTIGWSIFPWIGLSIEDVTVKGVQDEQLAHLEKAEVSVKLLPLLGKRVEMQTASLSGLELSLVKNANGVGNWQVDRPSKTASPDSTETDTNSSPTADASSPDLQINIANVEINNLIASYEDKQSGEKYIIDQANLVTGAIRNQTPFDFDLKARIRTNNLTLQSGINGILTFNLKEGKYDINELEISAYPDVSNPEKLQIVGNINIQQSPLQVNGELDVTRFNPGKLLNQIKIQLPPMSAKNAMSSLSFASSFETNGKHFKADTLKLQLDDFNISGYLNVKDIESQAMAFKFSGNDLNVDNYLPPSSDQSSTEKEKNSNGESSVSEQPLFPEEVLRGLNMNGSMDLTSMTVAGLRFDKPAVTLNAAGGQQKVTVASGFYQGTIGLDSKLDVRKKGTPRITANAELKGVSLEALVTPVPAMKTVQGTANAVVDVTSRGQFQSELTRNLNGKVNFAIDKGVFTDANFDKLVCEGISTIRKKNMVEKEWGKTTSFRDLSGTFIIRNGVASNNNLIAALSSLNLKGDGKIDLVQQSLDYHVGLNVRGAESPDSDPACQVNEDYVDVTWPVRCRGPIGTQQCGLDTERLADTVAGLLRNEAEKNIKKQIEDKVQGPVKDLLKGFFK